MTKQYRVNVYEDESMNKVISRVRYNQNLDFWDGRNWTCGSTGRHKGLTKLRDGRYVLIHGTDWQGEKDYAVIIDPEEALQEILKSNNTELLGTMKFKELNDLYQKMIDEDYEEAEDDAK